MNGRGRRLNREERVTALRASLRARLLAWILDRPALPIEWISERVSGLQDVLEARTGRSALILRELLGPIQLKPVPVDVGRPYYRAVTSIDALALIETPPAGEPAEDGSNSLRKWRRRESNPRPRSRERWLLRA